MARQMKHNKGFSLIELLIAITILSIVMVMIGQFMSSSTAAYKKTKSNLEVQSEAMNVISSITDTISQANYVRVAVDNSIAYTIEDVSGGTAAATRTRTVKDSAVSLTSDKGATIDYDFVSDDYPNHVRDVDTNTTERKIIINFDDYTFKPPKTTDDPYPQSGDLETGTPKIRSFRALKQGTDYYYVKPKYIYFEYQDISNPDNLICVVYRVDQDNSKIYLYREILTKKTVDRYSKVTTAVEAMCSSGSTTGLLTSSIKDFYLSADVEGNAILLNVLFEKKRGGYQYNSIETIKFRNTNAITVRPQKLYKEKGSGSSGGAGGSGGGAGGSGGGTGGSGGGTGEPGDGTGGSGESDGGTGGTSGEET